MGGVRRVVDDGFGALGVRAVRATIEGAVGLDAVADHLAAAVLTDRGELLDGALEAVERMRLPGGHHLERHLVVVATHFAYGHGSPPRRGWGGDDRSHGRERQDLEPGVSARARNMCARNESAPTQDAGALSNSQRGGRPIRRAFPAPRTAPSMRLDAASSLEASS